MSTEGQKSGALPELHPPARTEWTGSVPTPAAEYWNEHRP